MACNVGINPKYLMDQHLISEYRGLPAIVGSLKSNGWEIKAVIPDRFGLGQGHNNFFKIRLLYLSNRHKEVVRECDRRGFNCTKLVMDHLLYPVDYAMNWFPTMSDSMIVRLSITDGIWKRYNKDSGFWRHNGCSLSKSELEEATYRIIKEELYYV